MLTKQNTKKRAYLRLHGLVSVHLQADRGDALCGYDIRGRTPTVNDEKPHDGEYLCPDCERIAIDEAHAANRKDVSKPAPADVCDDAREALHDGTNCDPLHLPLPLLDTPLRYDPDTMHGGFKIVREASHPQGGATVGVIYVNVDDNVQETYASMFTASIRLYRACKLILCLDDDDGPLAATLGSVKLDPMARKQLTEAVESAEYGRRVHAYRRNRDRDTIAHKTIDAVKNAAAAATNTIETNGGTKFAMQSARRELRHALIALNEHATDVCPAKVMRYGSTDRSVVTFAQKGDAVKEFAVDPDEVEQCEACKRWSVSNADYDDGAIVCGNPDLTGYDRLCVACLESDD